MVDTPPLKGLNADSKLWLDQQNTIKQLIAVGKQISDLRYKYQEYFTEKAWHTHLIADHYIWDLPRWKIRFSKRYRRAKRQLQSILTFKLLSNNQECSALIDIIKEYQSLLHNFQEVEEIGEHLFGKYWKGLSSNWDTLAYWNNWAYGMQKKKSKGLIPEEFIYFFDENYRNNVLPYVQEEIRSYPNTLEEIRVNIVSLFKELEIPDVEQELTAIKRETLTELLNFFNLWLENTDKIYEIARYNNIFAKLRDEELEQIALISFSWKGPPQLLYQAFRMTWYEGLLNEAYNTFDEIRFFDRKTHEDNIQEFKKIDTELLHYAQEELVKKHFNNLPKCDAVGEMETLSHEMHKKRRHKPIRQLLAEAGNAIQMIKPIFMMSPMSVATYLGPGTIDFDLVVFDEASQLRVADALGSILRGKQVVVVGDTLQLPPTDFFQKNVEIDDEEAENSQTADIESILSMFLSKNIPQNMLKWHYRSKHDSLIAVSNKEFYNGKLMIFPSSGVNPIATGLRYHYIPDAYYERGSSRTNPKEARRVAEAVMNHAVNRPNLTLGVAAFSVALY